MRTLTMDEVGFVSGGLTLLDVRGSTPGEVARNTGGIEEMAESWGYVDDSGVVWVFANRGNKEAGTTTYLGVGFVAGYAGGEGREFIGLGIGIGGGMSSGTPSIIEGTDGRLAYSWSIGTGGALMFWWVNNDAQNAAFWGRAFNR